MDRHPEPATIVLTKHHGLANDFLIAVDPPRPLTAADARRWCDRHEGVGADGLIMAEGRDPGPDGTPARWRMTLWNADGGRAEISGNGIRCLGQALADHLGADRAAELHLAVDTDAGPRTVTVLCRPAGGHPSDDPTDGLRVDRVRVPMGSATEGPPPSDQWEALGIAVTAQQGVDLGNPHLVAFVDTMPDADMAEIGPAIECGYPGGCNVHVVRVVDAGRLEMRIWERGAGVTRACGSGACAAAWAANRVGLVGGRVEVVMPGGPAQVEVSGDEVVLTGPAVRVAEVRVHG